ncbi:sensor histidine kinase, partial [Segatella buccae]
LQLLFNVVKKGKMSFLLKGITLKIDDTQAVVKADRTLTLFMVNTIADNARKFTGSGGEVHIYAQETDEYVEIRIEDTGKGMDGEQLSHIFDHTYTGGHGFGLLNCKGIIEKYKKISTLFKV